MPYCGTIRSARTETALRMDDGLHGRNGSNGHVAVDEDGGGDVEEPAETSACQKRRLLILLSQTLGSGSIFFPRP